MAGIRSIISPQRTRLRVFLLAGLAVFLLGAGLVGCGGPSFDYTGTWEGQRMIKAREGEDQTVLNTLGKVKIIIKSTGSFEMFEAGLLKTGNVFFGGDKATMRITHIMDRPIAEYGDGAAKQNIDISLEPQKDGTLKYTDPNGFDERPLILTRQTQP